MRTQTAKDDFPLGDDQFWKVSHLLRRSEDPAKIVGVMNRKGGCGKTKTTIALGAYLAVGVEGREKKRVLLWDMDEQQSLTKRMEYNPPDEVKGTMAQWCSPLSSDPESVVLVHPGWIHGKGIEFSLVPAGSMLLYAIKGKMEKENRAGRDRYRWFRDLIDHLKYYFDYIIFDTGPSRNELHALVSMVAEETIVPFDGLEAFEGVADFQRDASVEHPVGANALLAMVKWQPYKGVIDINQNEVYNESQAAFPGMVCDHGVHEHPKLKRDYLSPPGYRVFDPDREYEKLVAEILEKWDDSTRPNFFNGFSWSRYQQAVSNLKRAEVRGKVRYAYKPIFEKET